MYESEYWNIYGLNKTVSLSSMDELHGISLHLLLFYDGLFFTQRRMQCTVSNLSRRKHT